MLPGASNAPVRAPKRLRHAAWRDVAVQCDLDQPTHCFFLALRGMLDAAFPQPAKEMPQRDKLWGGFASPFAVKLQLPGILGRKAVRARLALTRGQAASPRGCARRGPERL